MDNWKREPLTNFRGFEVIEACKIPTAKHPHHPHFCWGKGVGNISNEKLTVYIITGEITTAKTVFTGLIDDGLGILPSHDFPVAKGFYNCSVILETTRKEIDGSRIFLSEPDILKTVKKIEVTHHPKEHGFSSVYDSRVFSSIFLKLGFIYDVQCNLWVR